MHDTDNERAHRLENQVRVNELNPVQTLKKLGFKEGMTLCDIGAGTGIFSMPAAEISGTEVFALEISDEMIQVMERKKEALQMEALKIVKVDSDTLPLEEGQCDMVLLVTVLHELSDKRAMLKEINRVLKPGGTLGIVEFHKRETPMGPPVQHRLDERFVQELCRTAQMGLRDSLELGDNFYVVVAQKSAE